MISFWNICQLSFFYLKITHGASREKPSIFPVRIPSHLQIWNHPIKIIFKSQYTKEIGHRETKKDMQNEYLKSNIQHEEHFCQYIHRTHVVLVEYPSENGYDHLYISNYSIKLLKEALNAACVAASIVALIGFWLMEHGCIDVFWNLKIFFGKELNDRREKPSTSLKSNPKVVIKIACFTLFEMVSPLVSEWATSSIFLVL